MNNSSDDLSELIVKWQKGDLLAFNKAFDLLYGQVRKKAQSQLTYLDRKADWRTTVLVHECYLSLVGKRDIKLKSPNHFLHLSGLIMHRLLVDSARKRKAQIHGGKLYHTDFEEDTAFNVDSPELALIIDSIIIKLEKIKPELGTLIKLRCFAGYSNKEIADILDLPLATYNRRWKVAKSVLIKHLHIPLANERST